MLIRTSLAFLILLLGTQWMCGSTRNTAPMYNVEFILDVDQDVRKVVRKMVNIFTKRNSDMPRKAFCYRESYVLILENGVAPQYLRPLNITSEHLFKNERGSRQVYGDALRRAFDLLSDSSCSSRATKMIVLITSASRNYLPLFYHNTKKCRKNFCWSKSCAPWIRSVPNDTVISVIIMGQKLPPGQHECWSDRRHLQFIHSYQELLQGLNRIIGYSGEEVPGTRWPRIASSVKAATLTAAVSVRKKPGTSTNETTVRPLLWPTSQATLSERRRTASAVKTTAPTTTISVTKRPTASTTEAAVKSTSETDTTEMQNETTIIPTTAIYRRSRYVDEDPRMWLYAFLGIVGANLILFIIIVSYVLASRSPNDETPSSGNDGSGERTSSGKGKSPVSRARHSLAGPNEVPTCEKATERPMTTDAYLCSSQFPTSITMPNI